jgi:tetratricopeptide (TPR) repeat protein
MSSADAQAQDLGVLVQQALSRRDLPAAARAVAAAEAQAPRDVSIKLQKAMVRRIGGDLTGAIAALDEALEIDPYDFMALLSKGAVVERLSGERAAAPIYKDALKIAPPADRLPPQLKAPAERAEAVVARASDELEAFLRERIAGVDAELAGESRRRFDEAVRIFAGKARAYHQEPLLLHYPRLPAIPFYDRSLFPWLAELETATDLIRGELEGALAGASEEFAPYIAYAKGAPVNQWAELNHSRRWSSFFLWKDGVRQDAACARCPETAALLAGLPMAEQAGFAPTAMFSALEAKTRIPPHTGSTNARLLTHLPLILPGPAAFRVGNETRPWRMGEAWVFDDTIEHEAWNDADQLRVILIFDIWNPFLDEGERALVAALLRARSDFFAGR